MDGFHTHFGGDAYPKSSGDNPKFPVSAKRPPLGTDFDLGATPPHVTANQLTCCKAEVRGTTFSELAQSRRHKMKAFFWRWSLPFFPTTHGGILKPPDSEYVFFSGQKSRRKYLGLSQKSSGREVYHKGLVAQEGDGLYGGEP